jgi:hypothetical protein
MSTIIDRCNEILEAGDQTAEINSMNPVNKSYQKFKDRCDVDKAFIEYFPSIRLNDKYDSRIQQISPDDCKAFAVFFAERVKGGKL